jgi:cyanate permease
MWMSRLAVVALIVTAVNLRPAVTSIGPVLQEVRLGLGMSSTVAGLLRLYHALCFSLFGVGAPDAGGREALLPQAGTSSGAGPHARHLVYQ